MAVEVIHGVMVTELVLIATYDLAARTVVISGEPIELIILPKPLYACNVLQRPRANFYAMSLLTVSQRRLICTSQ